MGGGASKLVWRPTRWYEPIQSQLRHTSGSCGYGLLDRGAYPFWAVAGLATSNHFYSSEPLKACGECFEVECLENGPLGDKPGSCQSDPRQRAIVVMITDSCPECSSNQLDLQALTWAKIANPSPGGGRINIQFQQVECAPPSDLVVIVDKSWGPGAAAVGADQELQLRHLAQHEQPVGSLLGGGSAAAAAAGHADHRQQRRVGHPEGLHTVRWPNRKLADPRAVQDQRPIRCAAIGQDSRPRQGRHQPDDRAGCGASLRGAARLGIIGASSGAWRRVRDATAHRQRW